MMHIMYRKPSKVKYNLSIYTNFYSTYDLFTKQFSISGKEVSCSRHSVDRLRRNISPIKLYYRK